MSSRFARSGALGLLLFSLVVLIPAAGFAQAPVVQTVPYAYGTGGTVVPHPTWVTGYVAGSPPTCATMKQITLKGVVVDNSTGPYTYSWDYGDGTGATGFASVTDLYDVQATHSYCGDPGASQGAGTIFVANLTVQNASSQSTTVPYYIQVFSQTLDIQASVAIDEGLWNLHKRVNRNTCLATAGPNVGNSVPCAWWNTYGYYVSETAANTQAFFSAGHTETGNANDPYTADVQQTMIFLLQYVGSNSFGLPWDAAGDAFGLFGYEPNYYGNQFDGYIFGFFLSNLIASNNPTGVAITGTAGTVAGRTYKAIAQDMVDEAAYCQYQDPNYGAWRYVCQEFPDNSPSQWTAIGMLSGQRQWGLTIPGASSQIVDSNYSGQPFTYPGVTAMNLGWITYSQDAPGNDCGYGYGELGYQGCGPAWGPYATTGSGMVQMVLDGLLANSTQFTYSMTWQRDNWDNPNGWAGGPSRTNYYYGLLSFTKAMSLNYPNAAAQTANTPGITTLHSTDNASLADFDWYADPVEGVAVALINAQQADGGWFANLDGGPSHNYDGAIQDEYNTAWAIEMLNQTVIQSGKPIAVAKAIPTPGLIGQTITLNGSGSYTQDPTKSIVSWSWLINKVPGATGACTPGPNCDSKTGQFVTDTFPALGAYQAQLTVQDNSSPPQTASTFVTIQITIPPLPPTANAGGPYTFCNQAVPWILNGSASTSPDLGQSQGAGFPVNYLTSYNWNLGGTFNDLVSTTPTVNATSALSSKAPGTYLVQLEVTDNTALSFPASGLGNLTSAPASTSVTLQGNCACTNLLSARATPGKIQLTYTNVGANTGYNIYRSTDDVTFTKIGASPAGIYVYIDSTVAVTPTTYWYEVKPVDTNHTPNEYCTSNIVSGKSL